MGAILSGLFNLFTSRLGAIGAWAAVIALGVTLAMAKVHEGSLTHQVAGLQASIDAPATGWRARLTQCHANVDTLSADIAADNQRVEAWKEAAAAATARANAAMSRDAAATKRAVSESVVTLGLKPGADHCASALELIRSH